MGAACPAGANYRLWNGLVSGETLYKMHGFPWGKLSGPRPCLTDEGQTSGNNPFTGKRPHRPSSGLGRGPPPSPRGRLFI